MSTRYEIGTRVDMTNKKYCKLIILGIKKLKNNFNDKVK